MAPAAVTEDQREIIAAQNEKAKGQTVLQAISQGISLPSIPTFTDHEKHRVWALEHMAGAFRVFSRKGFTEGMSGHISVRDPEFPHYFWTNPLGRHFGLLKASDMILLDYSGAVVGGNRSRPANAAGFQIHAAVHKARPDVNAACHTHSKAGKAWSVFCRKLEMLNQDVCYFYGDAHAVYSEFGGIVFSQEEGDRLAAALGAKGKGLILRNHGILTVGSTVDEAAYLFTLMERSCEVQLMVEAAAANNIEKIMVPEEAAEYTFRMASDPESLYWEHQPDLEYEYAMDDSFRD